MTYQMKWTEVQVLRESIARTVFAALVTVIQLLFDSIDCPV